MTKEEWLKEEIYTDYYGRPFSIVKSPILMSVDDRIFFSHKKPREEVLKKLNVSFFEMDKIYKQQMINENEMSKYNKIFNLGLSKTGTTSFNSLMKELNLKSIHDTPISEHTIDELKKEFVYADCFSGTLAHRFKDIYEAWPQAKYILTTRNTKTWLKSARKQFCEENGMGMFQFREDVFGTYEIWKLSDEELIYKYNKINEEIKDFFKDKENFMELNFIDSTDKKNLMKKLLNFLEIESVTNLEFPHGNQGVR
jgi:hypothetical protein